MPFARKPVAFWPALLLIGLSVWPVHVAATAVPAQESHAVATALGEVSFSHQGGFYNAPITLTLSAGESGARIVYTLDGSEPTAESATFVTPLAVTDRTAQPNGISAIPTNQMDPDDMVYREGWKMPSGQVAKGTVVRARAVKEGEEPGPVTTHTYFVFPQGRSRYGLPVVSIVSDAGNFFDDERGIYVPGNHNNHFQSGEEWERPIHIEFWEADGTLAFAQDAGVRLHGNTTRSRAKKSLRIYAKSEYGKSWFEYPLFPDKPIQRYKRFLLRNAGNDWSEALFRDALLATLLAGGSAADVQHARPVVVFINGEYWGLHNLRDRLDERHVETHYGVGEDDMTMLENDGVYDRGDEAGVGHYREMMTFFQFSAMTSAANYQKAQEYIDFDSYIDHFVANMYAGNTDWPGNNQKFWRKNVAFSPDAAPGHDGRYRWMTYDADFAFGLNFHYVPGVAQGPAFNMVDLVTSPTNNWPNPLWSTLVFRRLMANPDFKTRFINRFMDLMNTRLRQDVVADQVERWRLWLEPEMQENVSRWGWPLSVQQWEQEVRRIQNFVGARNALVIQHLVSGFELGGLARVTVVRDSQASGFIRVNSVAIVEETPGVSWDTSGEWSGEWFEGMPVRIEAVPYPGYRFLRWTGDVDGDSSVVQMSLPVGGIRVAAEFERDDTVPPDPMNPAAHALSAGAYEFRAWDPGQPEGSFPPSMVFQQSDRNDPGLADAMTAPYHVPAADLSPDDAGSLGFPYRLTARTRMNGLGEGGVSFINTGRGRDLGAAVLALDTRGVGSASVGFTAGTRTPNSRRYAIRLQYRVGVEGDFLDLDCGGRVCEYVRSEQAGHSEEFRTWLPAEALGRPYVQLRWKYYFMGDPTSGPRAELWLDDVAVRAEVANSHIPDEARDTPGEYALHPNFPNPFNPATVVRYDLASAGPVRLEVYSLLGQRLRTVLDAPQAAGRHAVGVNLGGYASGVYLLRLQAGGRVFTRKLTLSK